MTRSPVRDRLAVLVDGIHPWDDLERQHQESTRTWLASGAPVYRIRKPDVPRTHLVSYFVVLDEDRLELLLVAHRKAGLWLPAGGHVEHEEDPWQTVVRECREELHVPAVPSRISGGRPFFLTVTPVVDDDCSHTDVSLWYVLSAARSTVMSFDHGEFDAIRWVNPEQVVREPIDSLDPHMHRFARKLLACLP